MQSKKAEFMRNKKGFLDKEAKEEPVPFYKSHAF